MIDFSVAWDKLAQFQSSDELAEFLEGEGVKAERLHPYACAISLWMRETTGDWSIWTNSTYLARHLDKSAERSGIEAKYHTPTMSDFVAKFDAGGYPALTKGVFY